MRDSFDASRGSGQSFSAPPPSMVSTALQTAVLGPTVIANLVGNICVCWVIWRVRTLRQKPGSSILASLAMSDFSWLSFLLFRLIWLYDFEAVSKMCEHFVIILATLLHIDIAHICLLSCDRYIAILYPLRYNAIVTRTRVKLALLIAWCAPVVSMVILPLLYVDSACSQFRTSILGCSESTSEPDLLHKVHLVFNITLFDAIPFAVLIFVYGHIAKISSSQSNRIEPGENLNPETADMRRRRRKGMKWMKTIVIVIGAFVFCYVPAVVYVLVTVKLGPSGVPDALRSAVIVMMGVNSALNPIIYMLRSNEFKRAFKNLFRSALVESSRATNTRIGVTCPDTTAWGAQHDLPSFLGVPVVSATAAEARGPRARTMATNEKTLCGMRMRREIGNDKLQLAAKRPLTPASWKPGTQKISITEVAVE